MKINILIILLFISTQLFSQSIPYYFSNDYEELSESKSRFNNILEYEKNRQNFKVLAVNKKPYDVLAYDIYLDWFDMLSAKGTTKSDRSWKGSNKITLKADADNMDTFVFDAVNLKIQSIVFQGKILASVPQPNNGLLTIKLPYKYKKGDTISFTINYQYVAAVNDLGFYLYPEKMYIGTLPKTGDSVFVESRLAYTMSEPQDARYWLPCNDQPDDKAIATVSVRVPKEFTAVSNGLIDKIDDMDNYKIFTWKDKSPITTYLLAITASNFATYSDWYKKVTNPKDSVEIQYYIWKKDFDATKTDGTEYNAHWSFSAVTDMMKAFSSKLTEYPFSKYGMVAVQPFNFGGMEHQTITTINRVWMRTNNHFGIAHELGHQWLGDLITCATWSDIWINEGGATWTEALWGEHLWGNDSYFSVMNSKRTEYLRSGGINLPPIYDLPVETIFNQGVPLVYYKASWIYHQLRVTLGDSVFYPVLRSMLNDFGGSSLTSDDFMNYFIKNVKTSPIDLNIFFDQWLMKSGHPLIDVEVDYTKKSSDYNANITISQTQSGTTIPDVFHIPFRFKFYGPNGIVVMDTLMSKAKVENYNVTLPFVPDSVKLDTSFSLFELNKLITAVQNSDDKNGKYSVSPNPSKKGETITIFAPVKADEYVDIELFDELGNKVMSVYSGYIEKGNYKFDVDSSNLISGVYVARIKSDGKIRSNLSLIIAK